MRAILGTALDDWFEVVEVRDGEVVKSVGFVSCYTVNFDDPDSISSDDMYDEMPVVEEF